MSDSIIIGKHTLESLTSGMYADPYVVFREYIQNSVDAVDSAVSNKVLRDGDDQIIIQLFPADNKITIKDNGIGIPHKEAEKVLISIGNSKKTSENSRGFRGIGRLAALSYCKRLTFVTSYPGENKATQIVIDAEKLSNLLAESSEDDVTVVDVLQKVYTVEKKPEKEDTHYFIVQMEGVDDNSGLNLYEDVTDYLSQNTPVPYSPDFIWGKEINNRLRKEKCEVKVYNISVQFGTQVTQIYKPYKDKVLVDKGKNIFDNIRDIDIVKITHPDGNLAAIGWLAKTNYLGSIYDKTVKGIRLRKGNILIGDHQTLNVVFKDARFNGWSMGEIFAVDTQLIPNARRDNFEKNTAFFLLFEQLSTLAASITKDIRMASLKRNTELSKAMEQLSEASRLTNEAVETGVTSNKKGTITQKIKSAQEAISSVAEGSKNDGLQEIAFEELDMLIGKLKGATSYKALNTIDKLTTTEKKILERVFNVIDGMGIKNGKSVIEAILNDFSGE